MKLHNWKIVLSVCIVLTCGSAYSAINGKPRKMQNIATGTWGGQHIDIAIEGNTATIEYDCANGTINGPFKLDRNGRFSLSGTHVRGHAGPIRVDVKPESQPARYTGWIDGKKMTLTVTLTNGNVKIGTFTLTHGQAGRLRKCY